MSEIQNPVRPSMSEIQNPYDRWVREHAAIQKELKVKEAEEKKDTAGTPGVSRNTAAPGISAGMGIAGMSTVSIGGSAKSKSSSAKKEDQARAKSEFVKHYS